MKSLARVWVLIALVGASVSCTQNKAENPVKVGADNPTIIGGTDATGNEGFAKTLVLIYDQLGQSICTGSILSDSTVLTAAYCLSGPATSLRVIFAKDFLAKDRIIRRVISFEVTPLWPLRKGLQKNLGDVAVLTFEGGLPKGYKPAQLIPIEHPLNDGDDVTLAGFGVSDGTSKTGSGRLRFVETKIKNAKFTESEILIDQTSGKGVCHGDSGGPAYVKIGEEWYVWGITNHGVNDDPQNCLGSSTFANVHIYRHWIIQTSAKLAKK